VSPMNGWGPVKWLCEIPRAEGKWLLSADGPLAQEGATWAVGVLTLTHEAFRLLEHRGTIGDDDGRITWNGSGVPVLHAGGAAYEVVACLSLVHESTSVRFARCEVQRSLPAPLFCRRRGWSMARKRHGGAGRQVTPRRGRTTGRPVVALRVA
jgi:hypothetical protein